MRWYIGVGTISAMAAALAACGSFSGSGEPAGVADGGTTTEALVSPQDPSNHFVQVVVATSLCSGYEGAPCGTPKYPDAHSCALRNDRRVWCWGSNKSGRLGSPPADPSFKVGSGPFEGPSEVTVLQGMGVKHLAAGSDHTCAVLRSGAIWCWGYNWNGQLGYTAGQQNESDQGVAQKPQRSSFLLENNEVLNADRVEAGEAVTCARDAEGRVACAGKGRDRERAAFEEPPTTFKQLSITRKSSCGVTMASEVVCSGDNVSNQIGGKKDFLPRATAIRTGASAISVGGQHTCVMENNVAKCWGNKAAFGGSGILEPAERFALPGAPGGGNSIDRVETGANHTCFIQATKAYCVGRNTHLQAGTGGDPKTAAGEPILGDVRDIAATTTHTCAVTTMGKVHCWGSNASKQLGVDNVDRSDKPVEVPLPN